MNKLQSSFSYTSLKRSLNWKTFLEKKEKRNRKFWVHLIFQGKKKSPKCEIPLYIEKLFPSDSDSNIHTRNQQHDYSFRSRRIMMHQHLHGKSQILVLSVKSKRFYPCICKREICRMFSTL